MKIKTERVNSELKRQISKVIAEDIKDPRMGGALVGVTKVYVTPDLKYAKVYLSIYAASDEEKKAAFDTVCRSSAFIRARLKDEVNIRLLPELRFLLDDSVDYSIKIDSLIAKMHEESPYSEDTEEK